MTESTSHVAVLRQVPSPDRTPSAIVLPAPYVLNPAESVLIGRDPRCQIVLGSQAYGGVSRQHAQFVPAPSSPSGWQICDLDSANGTYINGYRIYDCQHLQFGDRITLSQDGPQFVLELQPRGTSPVNSGLAAAPPPASAPVAFSTTQSPSRIQPRHPPSPDSVTFSQLFPIVSTGRDLTRKAYLIPGILTVVFVVLMFVTNGIPQLFNLLLAAYISGAAYYYVYQLCGKRKPWWVLSASAVMTAALLFSPVLLLFVVVFRGILPGSIPEDPSSIHIAEFFVNMLFGAGLMEELLKAIPVLLAYWVGRTLRSPWRERIGVWEPLDGILLGTASAVGFTLIETLGQYVPSIIHDVTLQAGDGGTGQLVGLQLLIPRILGSISGHMAYSGYFGYFIGLSVLKPSKRWQILGVGYLTASVLHALWNTTGAINLLVLAAVGVVSYAFLAAAILKARALSPTRKENFATRLDLH
ncbi:PrsW family glutamic-type intramembrane protease [Egbenema bharatensis]|uniref:PrsW family glutamic-type intramembrane protease n=1 Tax=Egbenema bharatensis TaxID=3463334 RepID=UPI003A8A3E44